MAIRAAVLTVSDGCWRGEREDRSGPLACELLEQAGHTVMDRRMTPDDRPVIAEALRAVCESDCDLIITTGGTGFAPRDVTPEATLDVVERQAPGLAEAVRWTSYPRVPRALLSRGVAGVRGTTLIINLPGSTGAVRDGLEALLPLLPHAVALMRDEPVDHTPVPAADTAPAQSAPPARVVSIETNLDDISPEVYESLLERLFAAGAVDVFTTAIQMKRNRPAALLTVLAAPDKLQAMADVLFTESSTFGLRYTVMDRLTLERRWETIDTPYGPIRIKIGRWKGADTTAAPEYGDVKAAADRCGVAVKEVFAAANAVYRQLLDRT